MTKTRRILAYTITLSAVLLGAVAIVPIPAANAQADAIATRRAGMKHTGENMGAIKKAVDAGQDVASLAAPAKEVADWGRRIPTVFPVGSETGGDTKALPAIWASKPDFETLAGNLAREADKLAVLAAANDKAGVAAQFQVLGGACGACHRTYRAR